MKKLANLMAAASEQLDGSLHPRVSVAWQDAHMVYRHIYADAPSMAVGKTLVELYEDSDATRALVAAKKRVLETGETHVGTYALTRHGKTRTYDMTIHCDKDDAGRRIGLVTVSVDITDILEAQSRLREANNRLLQVLDDALDVPKPRSGRSSLDGGA